jgi:hypothetical protein
MTRATARSGNTMHALVAVIALAAGCCAPGAGARAAGVDGVDETPTGDGAYIVRCKLGAFRSQTTAVERMRQRAGQLCPGGFDVLDSADGSSMYVRTVHGVQAIPRSEVALVVQCHPPRTAD